MFRLALRCVNRQLQQVLTAFFRLNRVLRSNSLTGNWTVCVRYRTESLCASYVNRDVHFFKLKAPAVLQNLAIKMPWIQLVGLFSYLALFRQKDSEFFPLTRIRIRILSRIDPHCLAPWIQIRIRIETIMSVPSVNPFPIVIARENLKSCNGMEAQELLLFWSWNLNLIFIVKFLFHSHFLSTMKCIVYYPLQYCCTA